MNELSLFTGAGGGLLGTKLLGWRHIGYVEINDYCQRIIAQRIADGYLDEAPIFTDIREFIQSGAAEQYRGFADVVTAGFPCQPFTIQGKRQGEKDMRNMWPHTAECIRMVRPGVVFLENVTGLLAPSSDGYFGTIVGDLAALGYVGSWLCLSSAQCGGAQIRDRVWIVAHDNSQGCPHVSPGSTRPEQHRQPSSGARHWGKAGLAERANQSELWRTPYGLADGLDRLKAIGNGQVSRVVATAWRLLTEEE